VFYEKSSMKRLGYPIALVFASLVSVVFITTVMAVTLASYSKGEREGQSVVKHMTSETVKR
jgi:hypothetical protein